METEDARDEGPDDEARAEAAGEETAAVRSPDETVSPSGAEAAVATTTERLSEPSAPLAVDALTLIEAYEQRNARLSERLRESVQAKLLVASAQADEAYKLAQTEAEEDKEVAHRLHAHVMEELGRLQEHELRAIGQELHPALIRMGLPGALRSLAKEFTDVVAITFDVDPAADSVGRTAGRAAIPTGQRLTLYRFATEAVRALAGAGATSCALTLRREGDVLVLRVSGLTSGDGAPLDRGAFAASGLAAEAYGGFVTVSRRDDEVTLAMELPAQPAEDMPEVDLAAFEAEAAGESRADEDEMAQLEPAEAKSAASSVTVFTLAPDTAREADEAGDLEQESTDSADTEDEGVPAPPNVKVFTLTPETADEVDEREREPGEETPAERSHSADADLTGALEALRVESADFLAIALSIDLTLGQEAIDVPQRKTTVELARAAVAALRQAHAQRCTVSVKHDSDMLMVSIISETDGTPFDAAPMQPVEAAVEALGGYVAVSRRDNNVSVTAEITASAITNIELSAPEPSSDAAA